MKNQYVGGNRGRFSVPCLGTENRPLFPSVVCCRGLTPLVWESEEIFMYYVPDGTERCGFYECAECGNRFLDIKIVPSMVCPYCGEEPDMELGPDDEMPDTMESAKLIRVLEGEEVEEYDTLLSLAITGGDYNWI